MGPSSLHSQPQPIQQSMQKSYGTLPKYDTEKVQVQRNLSLSDGIMMIVGSIVGSGIFITPKAVFVSAGSIGVGLVVWLASGLFSMLGALCFMELGTSIGRSGGEYAYLLESFGPLPAYLHLWVCLVVRQPTSLAIVALTFAQYVFKPLFIDCEPPDASVKLLAASILLLVTYLNCTSVRWVMRVQGVFTLAKVVALLAIVTAGAVYVIRGHTENLSSMFDGETRADMLALSFYGGLFSYIGWHFLNLVTEEMIEPVKSITLHVSFKRALTSELRDITMDVKTKSCLSYTSDKISQPEKGSDSGWQMWEVASIIYMVLMIEGQSIDSSLAPKLKPSKYLRYNTMIVLYGHAHSAPLQNLPRAITISMTLVTFIYVAVNFAYVVVIPKEDLFDSPAVAVTFGNRLFSAVSWLVPVAVAISTIGAMNGNMFTSGRVLLVGAQDGQLPSCLAMLDIKQCTPTPAIIITGVMSILMLLLADIYALINYISVSLWLTFGACVAGLLWMRVKKPDLERPIKVHIVIPVLFLCGCVALVILPLIADLRNTGIGLIIILTGFPAYYIQMWQNRHQSISSFGWLNLQKCLLVVPSNRHDQ